MGSIYRRKWKDKKTGEIKERPIWWIKYYRHGKPYRESSKGDKITVAERLLKKREGEIAEGKLPGVYFDKVKFDELAEDFLTDYRINGRDSLDKAERSVRYLKEFFGGMKATEITTDKVKTYIDKRMEQGMSNGSINRELAALKRMFHLEVQCTPPKVNLIPFIPMLKESNARKGFFEPHEYRALKEALPEELKPLVTFAYYSGWRKAEILGLTWDRVDLKEGLVSLDPGETKNEEGRTLYLDEELLNEMHNLQSQRRLGCPYVFHRDGQPIKDFRGAWNSACIKAGLFEVVRDDEGNETKAPTKIFHDFRRTAVRDMVRSGISEKVAMTISGHKTRSVFDRYNIVSNQDLKEAARKKQAYHESQRVEVIVQKRGEIIPFQQAQNNG
ncbi:MAG: tyrosine-type recombinase/integrase [Thermodesulfobacteriota bacterium]|jgi:integrase